MIKRGSKSMLQIEYWVPPPAPIYMLKAKCDGICSWTFGILLDDDCVTFMIGFVPL